MDGVQIKPEVLEVSLAYNPAIRKKFFMKKEYKMDKLVEILQRNDPIAKEEAIKNFFKEHKMSQEHQDALMGAIRLLTAQKDQLPLSVFQFLAKDIFNAGVLMSQKEVDEMQAKIKKDAEDKMKKNTDETSQALTAMKDAVEALQKEVNDAKAEAKIAKEAQRKGELKVEIEKLKVPGDVTKMVDTVYALEEANPALAKDLMEQYKTTSKALEAALVEEGSSGDGALTSGGDIDKKVQELIAKDASLTRPAAIEKIIKENPALYNKLHAERSGRRVH